jgi:hypothetical protein
MGADRLVRIHIVRESRVRQLISLRSYGRQRTLLSYEARTQATDEAARRAFLRYWSLVSPGVGVVMRSALAVIAQEARVGLPNQQP